jgi:putative salt-induced outer membrane protein YdiY
MKSRLVLGLLLTGGLLMADQVALKNGDRITGKIVKSDAKALVLKTGYAGEVTIDRAQIVSVASDDPLHVQFKDRTVVGQIAPAAGGAVEVKTGEGAPMRSELSEVLALRAAGEQKAWEREQERVLHPGLNDFWSGFVSLGIAGSSGNSKTSSIGTAAAASRQAGKNKMGLYFNQVYASQSNVAPFGATANRISGGYRIDRDVNPRMFVFGTTDFDYDKFLDLDLRSVLGGGLGYHIWKSDRGFWDFNAGAVHNREKFGTGLVRNSGEVLLGEESSHKLLKTVKFYQKAILYPNLSQRGEYRMNFDAGAAMPIFKWLEWNIGFSDRYLSNPILGKKSNDLLYTTGIRFSFDQTKR